MATHKRQYSIPSARQLLGPAYASANDTRQGLLTNAEKHANRKRHGTHDGDRKAGKHPKLHADVLLLAHAAAPLDRLPALGPGALAVDDRRPAHAREAARGRTVVGAAGVAAAVLVDALAVARARVGPGRAALERREALRDGLGAAGLGVAAAWRRGRVGGRGGGLGLGVVLIRDDHLGVAPAAEVGACSCGGGAPVAELGRAARFGQDHEHGAEVTVGHEFVQSREVVK